MKKIVGIALCLAAVIAIGLYVMLPGKTAVNSYARFLPPDALAAVNLSHSSTRIDKFAATPLGKLLAKDTIHAIAGERSADIAEYDRLYDAVAKVANDPAFRAVFGDDATLAMLPLDHKALTGDPGAALRDSLVVIARTSVAGALDMLSRLITNAQISRETVDGLNLMKITIESGQVFYGYTEGPVVFLACAPAAIKACLAAGKGEAALDKAPSFQEAAAFWQTFPEEKTHSRTYLNTPAAAELLKTADVPELKEAGDMLTGISAIYSIDYETSQGMESRGRGGLVHDQLHPVLKSMFDTTGKGNQTLHLLKENVLAYFWESSLQMEQIIKTLESDEKEKHQKIDSELRQNLGVSLEELGKTFGPQYGVVLDDIVRTPLFPWPKMILFVEVRDRAIAEKALNGMRRLVAEQGGTSEEQEQVDGQTIYSWPVMPGEVQPAALLTGNMLYLSTNKQTLKEMLAVKTAPGVLAESVAAQMGADMSGRIKAANWSNIVLFPARMARPTGEILEWLGAFLGHSSRQINMERLNRELVQFMQSTELVEWDMQVTRERFEVAMTVVAAKKPVAGGQ